MLRWIFIFLFLAVLARLSGYSAVAENAIDLVKVLLFVFLLTIPLLYFSNRKFIKKDMNIKK